MDNLDLLFRLLIAHFLGDFVFQPDRWIRERKEKRFRSPFLYLHALVQGVLAYLLLADWGNPWLPLILTGTHLVVDIAKSYNRESNLWFIMDQIVHIIINIFLWVLFYGQTGSITGKIGALCSNPRFLWIIFSYLFLVWPASIVIKKLTGKYQSELNEYPAGFRKNQAIKRDTGLPEAGKWIGILERLLILTFVILQQYQVIGFLVAAKSVFRFGDIHNNSDRKRIEYILIGTLLSFSIAIFTGILTNYILSTI